MPAGLTESFEPVTGTSVTLRPLRPADRDIESAFVHGLSPETRHNRLLGGAIAITREYIERLVNVDYSRDMALAATTMLEEETLIGRGALRSGQERQRGGVCRRRGWRVATPRHRQASHG